MAAKKGGLGKGLVALFAENAMEEAGKTVTLPIGEIVPNRAQPGNNLMMERWQSWRNPLPATVCCSLCWCGPLPMEVISW